MINVKMHALLQNLYKTLLSKEDVTNLEAVKAPVLTCSEKQQLNFI